MKEEDMSQEKAEKGIMKMIEIIEGMTEMED